ncbi:MAG: DNA-processing protein DprA [Bdellovibrionales bacterium]
MKRRSLTDKERLDWLRLSRTHRIGPITFHKLMEMCGSASAALERIPDLSRRGGQAAPLKPYTLEQAQKEIDNLTRLKGRFLYQCEPDYPEPLAAIEDAPPVIAVLGHPSLLLKESLGIVGARNASLNGRKMAERLAYDLGVKGYIITSGLARGIDTAAHKKALLTGTTAVLAGGVDVVYPEENKGLYEQIIESGCILSDQPMGTKPQATLFPRRNRLISGLSLGIIVVEAAQRSGSLITARMALEQGRDVFAVPGSPLDPRANGTNDLLRQGAILTETAQDVLTHLNAPKTLFSEKDSQPFEDAKPRLDEAQLPAAREEILMNLSTSPVCVDELVRECQLSLPLVHTILLELELAGRLERQSGNCVALAG